VATRVAELGAGLALSPPDVTSACLREAVGRVLDEPSFRPRLGEFPGRRRQMPKAADEILATVQRRNTPVPA
jgi:UDP:flavonoid glycosyltransferase YjiC (YdhE family)